MSRLGVGPVSALERITALTRCRGDHSPSYIYRLIKEAYDDEDVEL